MAKTFMQKCKPYVQRQTMYGHRDHILVTLKKKLIIIDKGIFTFESKLILTAAYKFSYSARSVLHVHQRIELR